MFGITDFSINFLTGQLFLTGLFFILFLILAVFLYRTTNPPLAKSIKILLTALRILAVIFLFLALFEPVFSYKREFERKPKLTLLIDRSGSMNISENNRSRKDQIDAILSSPQFTEFSARYDITKKYFAGSLADRSDQIDTASTALGEVLAELSRSEMADPSESWLLFSDGISNSGISPSGAIANLKRPIYSIGVGDESSEKDIAIDGIDYNQVVFAGKPTEITVHLGWSGMNNDNSRLEIRSGEKLLQSQSLKLPTGILKQDERFTFTPEFPGQQTFQVSVAKLDNEISGDNNRRSIPMTVLKSKLKVLLAADHLDWEYAFLNRFLLQDASVELTPVVWKVGGGYLIGQFPSRQEELNQYDLVILYDISIPALKGKSDLFGSYLSDRGGGLFVIMGENYLKASFPRWLDNYLPFVSYARYDKPVYIKFNGVPEENFLLHPAVRLSDDKRGVREGWKNLPPFEAIIPIDSVVPGAELLVTADFGAKNGRNPVLGFRNFGGGKVLASAAIPFWQWAFLNYGFGGEGTEYKTFFSGIINWLALKEDSDPIKIISDKPIYTRGEKIGFTASVFDLGFRPITAASGQISLINESPGDTTDVQFEETGEGKYRSEFGNLSPGRYRFVGSIEKDGKKLKETSGQIAVESYSIEDYTRRPNFGALANISQISGGSFYRIGDIDSLYPTLKKDKILVADDHEIIIWNKFWLLAIFILTLGIEWLLRKRYQLI
jgi:hypothetical protein